MTRENLIAYVADQFSVEPDYPWGGLEEGYVFRHGDNRKWFGVGLTVPYRRMGIARDGAADIVNVKCGPLLQGAYLSHSGIMPAYHMNKTHWLTILLDGTAEDVVIHELLDVSYELTRSRRRNTESRP